MIQMRESDLKRASRHTDPDRKKRCIIGVVRFSDEGTLCIRNPGLQTSRGSEGRSGMLEFLFPLDLIDKDD
ncbi:MAG TPA: hypothetical protein DD440_07365 [Porticoccaceae bacterium]|nr:hypothetical protein [Porticoccaceae bacterium]